MMGEHRPVYQDELGRVYYSASSEQFHASFDGKTHCCKVACDQCLRILRTDEVQNRASLAQDDLMIFSLTADPEAALFFDHQSAKSGALSAGWSEHGDRLICNRHMYEIKAEGIDL